MLAIARSFGLQSLLCPYVLYSSIDLRAKRRKRSGKRMRGSLQYDVAEARGEKRNRYRQEHEEIETWTAVL